MIFSLAFPRTRPIVLANTGQEKRGWSHGTENYQ
jgi:hypothetical protein